MSEFDINIDNEGFEVEYPIPIFDRFEKQKQDARKLEIELRSKGGRYDAVIMCNNGDVKPASKLTIQEQEEEIIKCATDPIYLIETYFTILDLTQNGGTIIPFKLFEFQKQLINEYRNNDFNIVSKYRQAGISTTTMAYVAWYICFNPNKTVAIVANLLGNAINELLNDCVGFIRGCPEWLVPKATKDTQKFKIYDNGSSIGAYAVKSGIRSLTPSLLVWDETAFCEGGDVFWKAASPTLQTGGSAIFVSTPSGYDPVYYKTFDLALKKENNFNAVEIYWFNDPRYNIGLEWVKNKGNDNEIRINDDNWSQEKRIKMKHEGWSPTSEWFEIQIKAANGDMRQIAQELENSFTGSGDNFIEEKYLNDIENNQVKEPIRKEYVDREMWIYEDPNPDDLYILATDTSMGFGSDSSSINILKVKQITEEKIQERPDGSKKKIKTITHKAEQVAEYYNKTTPQILAQITYDYAKKYNNACIVIDVTGGGAGIYIIEKLFEFGYPIEDIYYSEVEHKQTRERLGGYVKSEVKVKSDGSTQDIDLVPGFYIGANRPQILHNIQKFIYSNDIIIRSSRLVNEFKTFINVQNGRIADHRRSFHDDSIMGMAIGLYVLSFDTKRFNKKDNEKTKKMMNAILTMNDINEINKDKPKPIPKIAYGYNPMKEFSWVFKGLKGC